MKKLTTKDWKILFQKLKGCNLMDYYVKATKNNDRPDGIYKFEGNSKCFYKFK